MSTTPTRTVESARANMVGMFGKENAEEMRNDRLYRHLDLEIVNVRHDFVGIFIKSYKMSFRGFRPSQRVRGGLKYGDTYIKRQNFSNLWRIIRYFRRKDKVGLFRSSSRE